MPYNLYMNSLIKEVKEGWIMFLDDDDIWLEHKLSIQLEQMNYEKPIKIYSRS